MKCGLCGTEVKRNTEAPRDLMYTPVAKQPTKPSVERVEKVLKETFTEQMRMIAEAIYNDGLKYIARKIVEEMG